MFAGSVTSNTSTSASAIRARVLASLCSYSSPGKAATITSLALLRSRAEQQMLEHSLRLLELVEIDPFVGSVRGLLYVARSEQHAWYPRRVNEEARVAGGAPGRDPRRDARGGHGGFQRTYQVVLFGNLECEVVRAGLDFRFEPRHAKPSAGQGRLDLLEDLTGRLARVDAAVDLDHAAVRHDVRTRAAVDRPDRQARGAKHRMRAPRKLVVDGLQLDHYRRGRGDGVASQLGRRSVRRSALDDDPKVQQAPVADDQPHRRGFGQDRHVSVDAAADKGSGAR